MRYDLATGATTEILRPDWDVDGAGYSRDGKYFLVLINNDARTEVRLFEAETLRPLPLPGLQDGSLAGITFSRDGRRMAFYAEGTGPKDLFVRDMTTGQTRLRHRT